MNFSPSNVPPPPNISSCCIFCMNIEPDLIPQGGNADYLHAPCLGALFNLQFPYRVPFTKDKMPWCSCLFKHKAHRPAPPPSFLYMCCIFFVDIGHGHCLYLYTIVFTYSASVILPIVTTGTKIYFIIIVDYFVTLNLILFFAILALYYLQGMDL